MLTPPLHSLYNPYLKYNFIHHMAHTCTNAILHCIDFRIQKHLDRFIKEMKLEGDVDRMAIAGAVKNLGEAFFQLNLSNILHQTKHIYIINHQDCGAYGAEVAANAEKEMATHSADLLLAKQILENKIPGVKVHPYFVTLDGEFVPVELDSHAQDAARSFAAA